MRFFKLLKESWSKFLLNNDLTMSAALAFYAILSIVPFFALVFLIAGRFIETQFINNVLVNTISSIGSQKLTGTLQVMLINSKNYGLNAASLIGLIFLILGATALINNIQKAVNKIWKNPRKKITGKKKILSRFSKQKAKSVLTILAGVLMFLFFSFTSLIMNYLSTLEGVYLRYVNYLVWFLFMTFMFSFIFRLLPEKRPKSKEVLFGSVFTSIFFVVGQVLISLYFKISDIGSVFGALGGLIVLLIWLYYSFIVILFGAEFTHLSIKNKTRLY